MIQKWILCPVCGSKTRVRIREDTVLENFPLYCPKCKHETLISARQLNISFIKELDLCQYFEHKKLKGYADFFNSSSSFCCGVI